MTVVEPELAREETDVDPAVVAAEIDNLGDLKRRAKVRAFWPLPGIPEGTPGLVTLVNGWGPWIRYRVLFDNGADLGSINREHLVPAKRYAEMVEKRRRAIESGVFDQPEIDEAAADEGAEGGGSAGGGGSAVNGVTIPQHLLDRSAAARQRLGA